MRFYRFSRGGFSMVEIMVITLLFGMLVAMAVPPFTNYLKSNRLATNTDRLAADLHMARSIAISNGDIIRFTATADGYTITNPVDGTTFQDRDFDGGCALGADVSADFFPWGMADATVLNLTNCAGGRTINVLPTGMVEVEVD